MIPCLLSLPGWDHGPCRRAVPENNPILSGTDISSQEWGGSGQEQGAGGGRAYWNCGGTKAGLTMSAPLIRALFVVPRLRVRESRAGRKSGKNAALLCRAGQEAQVGPQRGTPPPQGLLKTTSDRPLSLQGLVKGKGWGACTIPPGTPEDLRA